MAQYKIAWMPGDGVGRDVMEAASRLESAIATVIKEHKVGTYDVGLNNTTLEVAQEVARKL